MTEQVTEKVISKFEKAAAQERSGLISECWEFLNQNKKWWLLPIVTVFFIFGILMLAGGTAAAPFIYTLF